MSSTTPTPGATRAAKALFIKSKPAVIAAALVIDEETRLPEILDLIERFVNTYAGPIDSPLMTQARALLAAHKQHRPKI